MTKRARLLILGNPIANRPDPVRVAEEMAFADVVSGGRVEVGFVRGAPMELSPTNSNPVDMKRRFWEAADLIVKAWTTHDGPFSWEGEFFHHREVNIWPRPYQQPHPPVWVTTLNPSSTRELAERDVTLATMINGKSVCGPMFTSYRDTYRSLGRGLPDLSKLAYCGFVYVGDTDEEALEEAKKLQWFVQQVLRTPDAFQDLPGYVDPAVRAFAMQGMARGLNFTDALTQGGTSPKDYGFGPIEPWVDEGLFFVGDADSVFEQLRDFYRAVGGFGNFLMMVQASTMSYESSRRSMERFVNDVLPRFRTEVHEPFVRSGAEAPAELG